LNNKEIPEQVADSRASTVFLPGSAEEWRQAGYTWESSYPLKITAHCASLIGRGLARDPMALQFVPRTEECQGPGIEDPLEESEASTIPSLIHRYGNRVLLMPTSQCAVNCRHCNRRWSRFAPVEQTYGPELLAQWVDYIRRSPDVNDVLVTGGDPLMLSDRSLGELLGAIKQIPHVRWIRVGTRMPTVQPARITENLCRTLADHAPVYLQVQVNAVAECNEESSAAFERLAAFGIPTLNQMVLLRNVNDDVETLASICNWLVERRCRPYYIFVPERVKGTSHLWVSLKRSADIAARLRRMLSGIAMPIVVVDTPRGGGKVPLHASMLREASGGVWVTDLWGRQHFFPEVGDAEAWGETTRDDLT